MAHVKITGPSAWDFGQPETALVKMSGRGLIGEDRKEFVKRAGDASSLFLPLLDRVKVAGDEELVHAIGLGSYEGWGKNRNGDAFLEGVLKEAYATFEKFARVYRSHQNKDPRKSYGVIKAAAYNPTMRRVELLLGLNKTKEAAERNGGLIADKELEKLAKDGFFPGSMACRVTHDVCSTCGNKARTRDEYCTTKCAAGGCRDNLAKLVKVGNDIVHVGVFNPDPVFFDYSHVLRPACRTAYGAKADWLTKAAEDGVAGIGGAKLAEELGVMAPLAVILAQDTCLPGQWDAQLRGLVKLAYGLDILEQRLVPNEPMRRALAADMQPPIDFAALDTETAPKTAGALGALAARAVILPLREFARLTKRSELCESASQCLKGAYGRMLADGSLERRINLSENRPVVKLASAKQRASAVRLTPHYSLAQDCLRQRAQLSALRGLKVAQEQRPLIKEAHDRQEVEDLARDYAIYKLAALGAIAEFDDTFLLTATAALHQNEA